MADTDIDTGQGADDELPSEQYEYVEEVVEYKDTRRTRIVLAVLLVLLALLLAYLGYRIYTAQGGSGAETGDSGSGGLVWVQSIYGWGPGADEQLIAPNTVAIGPDGLIWTNSNNRAAVAFNPDGSFDRILNADSSASATATPDATQTAGADSTPVVSVVYSLAVDSANNLYILDSAQENLLQTTPEAGIKQAWSMPQVGKIAANDSRVAALTKGTLGVFDPATGQPIFSFGSRGSGELQFDNPWGAHIDADNNVYVADTLNARVRKFDPTGELIWDAGTVPDRTQSGSMDATAAASALFELPTGVTTDGSGRVVVVDAFKYQIIVLDSETGKKVAEYGDYGQQDGQFDKPAAIAYDAERDWFAIADTDNNRLQIVRIPGSSSAPAQAALRRLFDRPVWICCFPFLILLIAALLVATSRRRKRKAQEAAVAPADGMAT